MKRWRYKKITPEMVKKMKSLRQIGWGYSQIAKRFDIRYTTVRYHLILKERTRTIERVKSSSGYGTTHRPYGKWQHQYMTERYKKDSEFREHMKTHVRKYNTKMREVVKGLRARYIEYDEAFREYYREKRYNEKVAWKHHKQRIEKLRIEFEIDFPLK